MLIVVLALSFIVISSVAEAQNFQRDEEEAAKDKEKQVKMYDELLKRKMEAERIYGEPVTEEEISSKKLVEVESNNVLPSDVANVYSLVPYKIRRAKWGHYFSVTYSRYNPKNYQSDFVAPGAADFEQLYGGAQTPLIEFAYAYKWNMALGSLAGELGYGTYSNDASDAVMGNANLKLQIARFGLRYTMDNFSFEPRLAPYVLGGVYTTLYSETLSGRSFNGNTSAAGYFGAGLMLQLNWIDNVAAVDAYTESGIENTFLFLEGRSFMASNAEKDPDFSTDVDINFGLTLEF